MPRATTILTMLLVAVLTATGGFAHADQVRGAPVAHTAGTKAVGATT